VTGEEYKILGDSATNPPAEFNGPRTHAEEKEYVARVLGSQGSQVWFDPDVEPRVDSPIDGEAGVEEGVKAKGKWKGQEREGE